MSKNEPAFLPEGWGDHLLAAWRYGAMDIKPKRKRHRWLHLEYHTECFDCYSCGVTLWIGRRFFTFTLPRFSRG